MTRLKLIKKITSEWFDSHKFVNEVYWGDFIRWYADKQLKHSSVIITPIRVTEVTRSKRAIQLQITYADRVYADFRNLDEVHSDADRTLADFVLSASNDKDLRKYLTGLTSGSIEYFTNRTGDLVAGATMSVSLNVFSDANSCEIPVEFDPTPPPFVCADANYIVQYDNGTLIEQGTIPSGGSVTVEVPNPITCQDANYTLTDSLGNVLDSGTIASGGSATITAPDATFTISDSQGNLIESGSIPSGGNEDVTLPEIWWERPEGWLPMPTITAVDNKFAGLYAVFEDGFNAVAIFLNNGTHTIDWGDGATSAGGGSNQTYNHVYDYATISGAVLVSDDGRNYKQVMVEVGYDATTNDLKIDQLTTPLTGTNVRSQNFLDVICSSENTAFEFQTSVNSVQYKQRNLQRIKVLGNIARINCFENLSLKVLDYDFTQGNIIGVTQSLYFAGNVRRDETGTPLNYFSSNVINASLLTRESNISKIGNIDFTSATNFLQAFFNANNVQGIGNINAPLNANFLQAMDGLIALKSLGVITVGTALTDIRFMFRDNFSLPTIVFAGDMSGVNLTASAFTNTRTLQRLILPNITVGFDIRNSQVTGTNLQDLFTSIGTASGVQTITLPTFTNAEPTAIATGKGYTIAYA